MLELLGLVLAAVVAICLLQLLANKTGLPAAALLTVAGLVYALLPGPNLTLHPEIILDLVSPPLIYSAALDSSLLAIRKNLRVVISLSIGLVLATALLTGVGLALAVPGMGLAAGVALGAAVSPTDPVAALAVGGRVGLPARLITIIEGEGLLNDATALTTLTVAVTAATSGGFSLGDAVLHFLLAAVGGLAAGVVVAVAVRLGPMAGARPAAGQLHLAGDPVRRLPARRRGARVRGAGGGGGRADGRARHAPVHLRGQPPAGQRGLAAGRLPAAGVRVPAHRAADRAGDPGPSPVPGLHDHGGGAGDGGRRAAAAAGGGGFCP